MEISALDVQDDAACQQAYDVIIASKSHERPWNASPSLAESVVEWRHVDKAEPMEMWAAEDGGGIVGVATVWFPMEDNTTMSWFDIQVDPAHRGRGVGSALMDRVVERSGQQARASLVADLLVPEDSDGHPYRRFMERHGFSLSNTEIMRHLDLPVSEELLADLAEHARARWVDGYRLETFVDGVPEAMRESLCALMNQLAVDAPTGDIEFEAESLTPARYAEYLDVQRRQGRARLTTVAVHESTGEVVAYTDLVLPSGAPNTTWQWGTYVHRGHRGHRLGMAVKIENLRRLQADHTERERVVTGNDDTNSWMVSINEQLGFRIVELCPAFQRKLG